MTQATVRVLDRQIRRWEIETIQDLRDLVGTAAGTFPLPRFPQMTPALEAWSADLRDDIQSAGDFFLNMVQSEADVALERDVGVIAGQLGREPIVWDTLPGAVNAAETWADRLWLIWEFFDKELIRQGWHAQRYDDDWTARIVSESRLGVLGRAGVGLVWSTIPVVVNHLVNIGYGMVNEERIRVIRELAGGT